MNGSTIRISDAAMAPQYLLDTMPNKQRDLVGPVHTHDLRCI